jgi:hypothetical protein
MKPLADEMYDNMSDDEPLYPEDSRRNSISPIPKADLDSHDMIPQSLTQNRYPTYEDLSKRELDNEDPSDYNLTEESDADEPAAIVEQLQHMVRLIHILYWYM